jgi:hypothetical protein
LALLVTLGLFKAVQPCFVAANLWHQVRSLSQPDMELATVEFNEPSLVWEFRRGLTNYMQQLTVEQAGPFLRKPGPRILILPTKLFSDEIKSLATNLVTFRSAGLDTARFRRLDLTTVVKTGSN